MTEQDELAIMRHYRGGRSPVEIREELGAGYQDISTRTIQRIGKKFGLERRWAVASGRLKQDHMEEPLHTIVFDLMVARGLDPYQCSECGNRQAKKCDIHHTKYDRVINGLLGMEGVPRVVDCHEPTAAGSVCPLPNLCRA